MYKVPCVFNVQGHLLGEYKELQRAINLADSSMNVDPRLCVPVNFFVMQKSQRSDIPQPTQYKPRGIKSLEDAVTTDIQTDLPIFVQEYTYNKLVVLSGTGGQGKTTQLLNMAVDWGERESHILSNFDLLFYIPKLPSVNISNCKTIEEVICRAVGLLPISQLDNLKHLLIEYDRGDKIVFLFDDFDETIMKIPIVGDIINGVVFPESSVILGGRPYWMKQFQCKREPDAFVDIIGLADEGREQIFDNLLNHDQTKVQYLLGECSKYIFDTTLLKIPLFATICCYVFQTTCKFNFDICQHGQPKTMTELFHCLLRVMIKIAAMKNNQQINVAFNRSPFSDTGCEIPMNIKRLLYHIGKLGFYGIKNSKFFFDQNDFKRCLIEPDEACQTGIMIRLGNDHQHTGNMRAPTQYSFRNKIFQEYMAGLYLADDSSVWCVIKGNLNAQEHDSCEDRSDDVGYHSYEAIASKKSCQQSTKLKKKIRLNRLINVKKKRWKYDITASTGNIHCTAGQRQPVEQTDDITEKYYPSSTSSELNLSLNDRSNSFSTDCLSERTRGISTKICLFNLLEPFQNVVLFACGANPDFLKTVLTDCKPFCSRKVCKWNSEKFDVGFEAALYCEAQDKRLVGYVFSFMYDLKEKNPTVIQFPRPYDEVVTVHLAQDLPNTHAEYLLKKWYNIDLHIEHLTGANMTTSEYNVLEMCDPCLFEVLLLHKFKYSYITRIMAKGNYFPGLQRLAVSFPVATEIIFDSVNFPSLPSSVEEAIVQPALDHLRHLHLLNIQASYPLNHELQSLLRSCQLHSLCLQKVTCNVQDLFQCLIEMRSIERLQLSQMNFQPADLAPSIGASLQTEYNTYLADVLYSLPNLTCVDLSENNIDQSLPGILHSLCGYQLRELSLRKCCIKPATFIECAQLFEHFKHLMHLDVSFNPMGKGLITLLYHLSNCSFLKSITMKRCSLNPEHFKGAACHIKALTALQSLDVSCNSLASSSQFVFSNLPVSLEELYVEECDILPSDAINSARSLQHLPCLRRLDIRDNPIHGGVETLINALKKHKQIEILHLQKCRILPVHFGRIMPVLAGLPRLKELGIGQNTCGDSSQDARNEVVKYLCQCKKLEKVQCCVFFERNFNQRHVSQLQKKIKNVTVFKVDPK